MIFLRVLPKIFLWPHYSGPQELGARFIEPPEPPVPTLLTTLEGHSGRAHSRIPPAGTNQSATRCRSSYRHLSLPPSLRPSLNSKRRTSHCLNT